MVTLKSSRVKTWLFASIGMDNRSGGSQSNSSSIVSICRSTCCAPVHPKGGDTMPSESTAPATRIGKAAIAEQRTRCHFCNNEGKEGGCPRCGLTPRSSNTVKLLNLEVPTELIPTVYQGVVWEKPEGSDIPLRLQQYDNALEKVYNQFLSGRIPAFSM